MKLYMKNNSRITYRVIPVYYVVLSSDIKEDMKYNEEESHHLLDLLIPEEVVDAKNMLKDSIFTMRKLCRWFTMYNDPRLLYSFSEFLSDLSFSSLNYIRVGNLVGLEGLKVDENYGLIIGEKVFSRQMSEEEFSTEFLMNLLM